MGDSVKLGGELISKFIDFLIFGLCHLSHFLYEIGHVQFSPMRRIGSLLGKEKPHPGEPECGFQMLWPETSGR
jgi:hypothetical protein